MSLFSKKSSDDVSGNNTDVSGNLTDSSGNLTGATDSSGNGKINDNVARNPDNGLPLDPKTGKTQADLNNQNHLTDQNNRSAVSPGTNNNPLEDAAQAKIDADVKKAATLRAMTQRLGGMITHEVMSDNKVRLNLTSVAQWVLELHEKIDNAVNVTENTAAAIGEATDATYTSADSSVKLDGVVNSDSTPGMPDSSPTSAKRKK